MKYLINDYTYLYDDYECTKKQFIKDNKDGYKWYVNGIKHTDKRINGRIYLVLYIEKDGTQWAKRFLWTNEVERIFTNEDVMHDVGIDYVEMITDLSNLEEVC